MKAKLIVLLSLIVISACSNTGSVVLKEKNQAFRDYVSTNGIENVDKVTPFKFHGWNSLTDDFLVISTSPKRRYLVELSGFCSDIRWAHTIKVNRTTSSALYARFDSISSLQSPQVNCMIKTIYPLTPEQYDEVKLIDKKLGKEREDVTSSVD